MTRLIVTLVLMNLLQCAIAEEQDSIESFLCISDKATGFLRQNGEWISGPFKVSSSKYILRRPKDDNYDESGAWVWVDFGRSGNAPVTCENEPSPDGTVYCNSYHEEIIVNLKNLRFQKYYRDGYVKQPSSEWADTPLIEIGRCSAI